MVSDDAVDRVRAGLRDLGAEQESVDRDSAFVTETHRMGELWVLLESDYGQWRASVRHGDGAFSPVSFWLAALDGSATYPDPAVTEEDLLRLAGRLRELVVQAARLAPMVDAMGERYRSAMRDQLGQG